ncbi:MAG: DUF6541 family protein [Planctomycetota bacterium]
MEAGEPGALVAVGPSPDVEPLDRSDLNRVIWFFVVLGAIVYSVRFGLRFPLWPDECYLAMNYLRRGYLGLLEPLDFRQVAPPLFLWAELTVVKLLGFSEWTLRLLPFGFALSGLVLFRKVASELIQGSALALSVGIFAVSYFIVRYSAEAKPYSLDVLVTLTFLWLAVRWWRQPSGAQPLWVLAAFVPLAFALSFPAVFIAGGVSCFALFVLWRSRCGPSPWIAWAGFNVVLLAAFAGSLLVMRQQQGDADLEWMQNAWERAFPPLTSPVGLPLWLLDAHTGEMLAYPVGGKNGASSLTALLCLAGVVTLWRTRRLGHLILFLSPFALNFVAAALERYPYGAPTRTELYLAPIVCILAGLGGATLIGWIAERSRPKAEATLAGAMVALVVVGVVTMARDISRPAKTPSDQRIRAFAQAFWPAKEQHGEVACLRADLGVTFSAPQDAKQSPLASYLVHQRIYSPRHAVGESYRLDTVSADHPLRLVHYRIDGRRDGRRRDHWLEAFMKEHALKVIRMATSPMPYFNKDDTELRNTDVMDVFTLVPDRDARE